MSARLFDAEFYALLDGAIFEIDIQQFLGYAPEQLQMRFPIHVSDQSAAQLLWSTPRVHFHCT